MNELDIIRTPELIGAEIRTLTVQARRMTLYYCIEIGRRLTEAKEMCAHGEWLDFLKKETEFSQPTASRFMKAFEEYGEDQSSLFGAESKYSTLNNLSISNALKLLAIPEEERESFALEVDAEHISTRELQKAIDEKLAAEERAAKAENDLETARKEIKELEARPVEVAVERDEQAIADARAEAEQANAAKIAELTAQLSEAQYKEAEAKAAEKKAKEKLKQAKAATEEEARTAAEAAIAEEQQKAAEAVKEADELRRQLAAAQEKLKTADPDTAVFAALFETVQVDFGKLLDSLERIRLNNPERGDQLRAAVNAVLDNCAKRMG